MGAGTPEPDWASYLDGVAVFAGTLFALVLAARQLRRPLLHSRHPTVSRAYLFDSISVTVELGAAAALALLYDVHSSQFFTWAVCVLALGGFCLSLISLMLYVVAITGKHIAAGWERAGAIAQAITNVFPMACYFFAALYALRVFHFTVDQTWGYVALVSWLCFSGIIQSIVWYSRIWNDALESARRDEAERAARQAAARGPV